MRMKRGFAVLLAGSMLFAGCTTNREMEDDLPEERTGLEISLASVPSADSALLLFFRKYPAGDSFAFMRTVQGLGKDLDTYTVHLPVGYYQMVVIGNGQPDHIRIGNPPSIDNSAIVYENGESPPDLYFGNITVNVGEQKKVLAGLIILSSKIALTVRDIPEGVDQVDVDLKNTIAGLSLRLVDFNRATDPCITESLYEVTPGSSPEMNFKSLASVPADSSFFEVRCYDATNAIVYRGRSRPFWLHGSENIRMECSFASGTVPRVVGHSSDFILYPEIRK